MDLPQKIAIVGGGPAGLSAAFYCRKMGYPVTVFEKESRPGGMLLNGIPSFRLEKNIIDAEIEVLRQMGVTFKCGVEVGKDVTIQQLREEGFKAFYVAIGAQGGRKAGVPGEDADGVKTGVEFLRSVNLDELSAAVTWQSMWQEQRCAQVPVRFPCSVWSPATSCRRQRMKWQRLRKRAFP